MYGSNFHLEQTVSIKRASTESLGAQLKQNSKKGQTSLFVLSVMAIMLAVSTACYAGPSQSKLPGGNGNAGGR